MQHMLQALFILLDCLWSIVYCLTCGITGVVWNSHSRVLLTHAAYSTSTRCLCVCACVQVERVLGARVPVLNFKHSPTLVDCDIIMGKPESAFKARFLRWVGAVDL